MDSVERIKNRLRNLKQNANLSEEEIEKLAQEQLEKTEILGSLTFVLPEEMDFATTLLEKYLAESSIESSAEKDTLRQLIDVEVLLERIKHLLNTEYSKANPAIPVQLLQQVTELNKQILDLKETLGLVKKEGAANVLDEFQKLKEKALNYYKDNAGANVCRCPYCQKLFMILKDLRGHTTEKISLFKKTLLYNKKLFELIAQNKITREEASAILGCTVDYIEYIYENVYLNDK